MDFDKSPTQVAVEHLISYAERGDNELDYAIETPGVQYPDTLRRIRAHFDKTAELLEEVVAWYQDIVTDQDEGLTTALDDLCFQLEFGLGHE